MYFILNKYSLLSLDPDDVQLMDVTDEHDDDAEGQGKSCLTTELWFNMAISEVSSILAAMRTWQCTEYQLDEKLNTGISVAIMFPGGSALYPYIGWTITRAVINNGYTPRKQPNGVARAIMLRS